METEKKKTVRCDCERKALVQRLHRIAGQIAGIERMVEQDAWCGDVLIQLAACQKAMQSLATTMLDHHLHSCVIEQIESGDGQAAMDEVISLVKKLK